MKKIYFISILACILISCNKEDDFIKKNANNVNLFEESITFTPEIQLVNNKYEILMKASYPTDIEYLPGQGTSIYYLALDIENLKIFDGERELPTTSLKIVGQKDYKASLTNLKTTI